MKTFAAWLMDCIGVDEAIAGDLLEERAAGRSRAWYARQVLGAVAVRIVSRARHRWVPVLEVFAAGSVVVLARFVPTPWVASAIGAWIILYACCGLGIVLLGLGQQARRNRP